MVVCHHLTNGVQKEQDKFCSYGKEDTFCFVHAEVLVYELNYVPAKDVKVLNLQCVSLSS